VVVNRSKVSGTCCRCHCLSLKVRSIHSKVRGDTLPMPSPQFESEETWSKQTSALVIEDFRSFAIFLHVATMASPSTTSPCSCVPSWNGWPPPDASPPSCQAAPRRGWSEIHFFKISYCYLRILKCSVWFVLYQVLGKPCGEQRMSWMGGENGGRWSRDRLRGTTVLTQIGMEVRGIRWE
jgi:hypothetical protein